MTLYQHHSFGSFLREARRKRSISYRDLAYYVSMDYAEYSKIENGRRSPPSDEKVEEIIRGLDAEEWEAEVLRFLAHRPWDEEVPELNTYQVVCRPTLTKDEWEDRLAQWNAAASEWRSG